MRALVQELRSAPTVWCGVLLALTVSQCVLASMRAAFESIASVDTSGHGMAGTAVGLPLFLALLLYVFVVLWVLSSAIQERRRQLALLVLQGATPGQLLWRVVRMMLVLFLLAALVSYAVAPFCAPSLSGFLLREATGGSLPYSDARLGGAMIESTAMGLATVLAGTVFTVRRLASVEPVEALRSTRGDPGPSAAHTATFALTCSGAVLSFILTYVLTVPATARRLNESDSNRLVLLPMLGMLLTVIAVSLAAPPVFRACARLWASLPIPSVSWRVAGRQAAGRIRRQSSTMMPMVMGLSVFMTLSGLLDTMTNAMRIVTPGVDYHAAGIGRIFAAFAPAMVIAAVGVVAGLTISARNRRLDLALIHVSGADAGQLRAIACLDGGIMMGTAVLLSFLIVLIPTLTVGLALDRMFGVFAVGIQLRYWLVTLVTAVSIGSVATGIQGLAFGYDDSVAIISSAVGE